MTLQKKYYYSFKGLTNIQYDVEIWQNTTTTITAEEITGDAKPFKIEYPQTDIFTPVKGSGCELNLLSTEDRKFLNLYTADILEYQIRFFKAGVMVWCGYLDSELYNEPFTELTNYCVTFTGSCGFALLDRFNYVDAVGNNYTGLQTQWQVLQNVLNKLSLPYQNIYVGLSTISNDFTLASAETLLHKTYCNSSNWYNEDGDAETARKVLEEILKPYGAYIIQDQANIYICDVNAVAGNTSTTFKRYNSSYTYLNNEVKDLNLGDISSIGLAASDLQMTVVSGFNKQVLKYSPYKENIIIDYKEEIFSGATTTTTLGQLLNTWEKKYYESSDNWNKLTDAGKFCEITGTGDNINSSPERYLVITPIAPELQGNAEIFTYKKSIPDIVFSSSKQFYLKVDAKLYLRTLEDKSSLTSTLKSLQVKLKTNLIIGNKRYRWDADFNSSRGWYDISQPQHHTVLSFTNVVDTGGAFSMANISDTWIDSSTGYIDVIDLGNNTYSTQTRKPLPLYIPIPLNGAVVGNNITFSIGDYKVYDASANRQEITTTIQDIKLKDIKLTIVDSEYKEIEDKDVEYLGYMNKAYKNEAAVITNYQGSSVLDSPIEKGSLMGYNTNYYYLNTWTREGKTDCIENLLLRSMISNYTNKRTQLTGTLNQINGVLGCLTYSNYLQGINLMITGITTDFAENTSVVNLIEIEKDNLEINKSW